MDDDDNFGRVIHLRRPRDAGGGVYCGEMCFGMGSGATSDRLEANCGQCRSMLELKELTERLEQINPLDTFVRRVEEKPGDA